uniref:sarcoplasmic reticulum histidine-rich calcium-binding protein isoform X1 n=1 Tax=Scatophagus argus TaxID=75038 RepID=UPI001ED8322D|nr:sarcoplasmic reticulum histidine-rich calcium-binding protein isoform X1 [Scatophagus argus]
MELCQLREAARQNRWRLLEIMLILLARSLSPHRPHAAHTSAGPQVANMYKMYDRKWDDESDDDKNSLNSSFWSDGERPEEEEEEEEVEIEPVAREEDSKPAVDGQDSQLETSEEEEPELKEDNMSGESLEGGSNDDGDEEESHGSSCDSPAPSLMTSGYGTYRPEEQEGGDYVDDHTAVEFDQDSRGDLSETRDSEEDDRSLCSFSGFDINHTEPDYDETRPLSVLPDAETGAEVADCGDERLHAEVDVSHRKAEEEKDQTDQETFEHENETNATSEDKQHVTVVEDKLTADEKHLEGGGDGAEREEEEENNKEKAEDQDESSSNINFIDSKVDFSRMTHSDMCEQWEGNLRQNKMDAASCLEERLAELHLSTSAHRDLEMENEDVTSDSDGLSSETGDISVSAFESYIRGMTRAQSDVDFRPKPKSFIRPVMSQQTLKKTDPVAKYFQYKQLWEMFKLPGEKDRRALRLEIKERLAYQPPPPKPRRVYVPNTYVVPTEKKRSALRWEIRNDLANGLLPYKFSY